MITVRRAGERGHAQHGWLDSHHTFSFANYFDPAHMGFSDLRVINDDRVQAGEGFGTHGHRDMEILSWVLEGSLKHADSMGTGSVIVPGEAQLMSAGTGVTHSEHNASRLEPVHFLQIWILPARAGTKPSYQQKAFPEEGRRGRLQTLAAPDGRDGALTIGQDVVVSVAEPGPGDVIPWQVGAGRAAWLHVAKGKVHLDDLALAEGDGVALETPGAHQLIGTETGAQVLLFDLRAMRR